MENQHITNFIANLKQTWKPDTRTTITHGRHGSKKGDEITFIEYFDNYRCEWTYESKTFQGYVFQHINQYL